MSVQYIKHDVTQTSRGVVAHGCNCNGVMGSGVALAIKKRWPVAYQRYHQFVERWSIDNDREKLLGLAMIINVGSELSEQNILFVSNMFTQLNYGRDGKVYASPEAIRTALMSTMSFCRGADLPLYMPRVGCGLGGLSWEVDVRPIVDELAAEYDVEVFVCDL